MKGLWYRLALLCVLCGLIAVAPRVSAQLCGPGQEICTDKACNTDCANGRIWCKTHPGQWYEGEYAEEYCGPPIYSMNQCDADWCNYCGPIGCH
jgi:hypothetical protein